VNVSPVERAVHCSREDTTAKSIERKTLRERAVSITSDCLVDGSYEFTVYDEFCDGINAPGYYTIYLNGEVLATNSNFGSSETTRFLIESSTPVEVSQPTDEWVNLMYEDFIDGLGPLTQGG